MRVDAGHGHTASQKGSAESSEAAGLRRRRCATTHLLSKPLHSIKKKTFTNPKKQVYSIPGVLDCWPFGVLFFLLGLDFTERQKRLFT